jgi:TPR repeat protein
MYSAAAAAGDPESNYFCGDILEHGRGVAVDKAAAKCYYQRAADAGHAWGQTALGWMLEHGDGDGGGSCDVAAAVVQYKTASLQGHAPAQYHLGCIYLAAAESSSASASTSLLVPQVSASTSNAEQHPQTSKFSTAAQELFRSAAKNGHVPAQVTPQPPKPPPLLLLLTAACASGCTWEHFDGRERLRAECRGRPALVPVHHLPALFLL